MSTLASVNGRGVNASRPAAGIAGALYLSTDIGPGTWYRDNGSSWDAMTTSNPMTNVGDIVYGGTAGAPTRLADVATGSVLLSGGVNTAPSWGYAPISTVDAQLGNDVAASAGAFVDVLSITLTTGTWDLYGWLQVLTTSAGPQYLYTKITDSAGTTQYAYGLSIITTNSAYNIASVLAPALVISGSTTLKLRGQTDGTANFKGSTSLGAGGGTKLHAVRIA